MTLRSWATPLVIGAFLVMAVSGTLMFFHLDSRLNNVAHEWGGWVLVAAGIAHLILNWRAFSCYLKRPLAVGIMGAFAVVLGLSFVPLDSMANRRGNDVELVMGAIGNASVETLAELSGQTSQEVITAIEETGLADVVATDTVSRLAGGNRERQGAILSAAFGRMRVSE